MAKASPSSPMAAALGRLQASAPQLERGKVVATALLICPFGLEGLPAALELSSRTDRLRGGVKEPFNDPQDDSQRAQLLRSGLRGAY